MVVGVKALALGGHVTQQLGHLELRAVFLREVVAFGDELPDADLVDQADRAAGLGREAQAHDRADVAVLRVGEHVGFQAARGVDRLDIEQALLDLVFLGALLLALAIEQLGIGREVLGKLGPQALLAVGRIFVEALAVLAAEALELMVKKPRLSFTTIGVLRIFWTKSMALASVSGEVFLPTMISTSGIFSTGEKKCRPMK